MINSLLNIGFLEKGIVQPSFEPFPSRKNQIWYQIFFHDSEHILEAAVRNYWKHKDFWN